jgi:CDGSH-type Zn-finger protein
MGGFELPPLGNITDGTGTVMVFSGEIKVCGEDEKSLGFELGWDEDDSQKARIFIKTTSPQGLKRLMGIGTQSGVFEKINAKRVKAGKKPILSDKGTVKTKILQDAKFHEQLRQEIEGCKILCTITHSPAKPYEDKVSGEMKEGFPQANIGKIAAPGSVKKSTKAATEESGGGGGGSGSDDDEWED